MSSSSKGNKTPTKMAIPKQASPAKFVKPADLFKMRRRSSNTGPGPSLSSNQANQNQGRLNSLAIAHMRSSPMKATTSNQFNSYNSPANINNNMLNISVSSNPATLSAVQVSPAAFARFDSQSPLKCLNNLTDPSPTKKLPVLLRNPFNKPVKRRLNLSGFSPKKDGSSEGPIMRSPNKKTRMLELDEDANLEPPKMKQTAESSNWRVDGKKASTSSCLQVDLTLKTRLRIVFDGECKNWIISSSSTHKRLSNGCPVEDSPSKLNDNTISEEAIKNASVFYQHPYLAWLPLYPRDILDFNDRTGNPLQVTKNSPAAKMMHNDWCESLSDLANLLICGKCPYFYMCFDHRTILFRQTPSSKPRKPLVQAYISPLSHGLGLELNQAGIEFRCPELTKSSSSSTLAAMNRADISQHSFGSSQTRTTLEDTSSQQIGNNGSRQAPNFGKQVTPSVDSGNVSDSRDCDEESDDDDDDDFGGNENDGWLESIGLSQHDLPSLQERRRAFIEADSNTQNAKNTKSKPLAEIEGVENVRKLVEFLQSNSKYNTINVGKFANIPPTLLSPNEFRLCTPRYPEVSLNRGMIETAPTTGAPTTSKQTTGANVLTPKKNHHNNSSSTSSYNNNNNKTDSINIGSANSSCSNWCSSKETNAKSNGPSYVELRGAILPNLFKDLHKLLTSSDNLNHTCISTALDSSLPFKGIQFCP